MPGYDDLTPGRDDAAEFDFGLDFDEERSRLLLVESAREAAAERSRFVGAVVTELVRISSDAGTSVAPVWAQMLDDIDATAAELMMRQACYRAAGQAIAEPVAASLAAFLA